MGIPRWLLDNSYGKVRGCWETSTCGTDLVLWCNDEAEALERCWPCRSRPDPEPAYQNGNRIPLSVCVSNRLAENRQSWAGRAQALAPPLLEGRHDA